MNKNIKHPLGHRLVSPTLTKITKLINVYNFIIYLIFINKFYTILFPLSHVIVIICNNYIENNISVYYEKKYKDN